MSAAIIAAATVAGGVISGGASIYASQQASSAAADASKNATAAASASSAEQLAFNREQWEAQMADVADIEAIFGPVKDNLSKYYQNMSVEQIQLRGKEQLEKQYVASNENIDKVFSNNGMYNSGQRASAQVALEASREEALGANLQNAEQSFNTQQLNWLNVGIQEKNTAQGLAGQSVNAINQSYGNAQNIVTQGGANLSNIYSQQSSNYADFAGGMFNLAGYAAGGGFKSNTALTTRPVDGGINVNSLNGLTVDWK